MSVIEDLAIGAGKEIAHLYKWRSTQFPFEIRRRTFAEMAAYPEMPAPVHSLARMTFTPWKMEELVVNYFSQMDLPLQFAMGDHDFNYEQLQEYLERERLRPMTSGPRRRTILDQQFIQTETPISVAVVDTYVPAYGLEIPPRNWIIQFGLDRQENVREVAVQKFTMF
jgi:hypothetical protein